MTSGASSLVEKFLWLAHKRATAFVAKGYDYDDALSDAYLGLCRAAELYDAEKGAAFRTYAANMIDGYIRMGPRDRSWRKRCADRGYVTVSIEPLIERAFA